jgi:hypothetical protein
VREARLSGDRREQCSRGFLAAGDQRGDNRLEDVDSIVIRWSGGGDLRRVGQRARIADITLSQRLERSALSRASASGWG